MDQTMTVDISLYALRIPWVCSPSPGYFSMDTVSEFR